jgi:hypothetical protein
MSRGLAGLDLLFLRADSNSDTSDSSFSRIFWTDSPKGIPERPDLPWKNWFNTSQFSGILSAGLFPVSKE